MNRKNDIRNTKQFWKRRLGVENNQIIQENLIPANSSLPLISESTINRTSANVGIIASTLSVQPRQNVMISSLNHNNASTSGRNTNIVANSNRANLFGSTRVDLSSSLTLQPLSSGVAFQPSFVVAFQHHHSSVRAREVTEVVNSAQRDSIISSNDNQLQQQRNLLPFPMTFSIGNQHHNTFIESQRLIGSNISSYNSSTFRKNTLIEENFSTSFDYDTTNFMAIAPYGTLSQSIGNRRLFTEIQQLENFPITGCYASPREENIFHWTAVIDGPHDTVYEGGTFFVELLFNLQYPFLAPKIVFLTRIYHCNINSQGKVCMDTIINNWNSCMTISTILQSLISLLYACNPKDSLVPSIADQFLKNPEEFKKMARLWTQRYAQ